MKMYFRIKITCIILLFVFYCGIVFSQTKRVSSITKDNYYEYFLPNEKVVFLSKEEIKIILKGELTRLGFSLKDFQCDFLLKSPDTKGTVIWIDHKPFILGIFLKEKSKSFSVKDRTPDSLRTTIFKCTIGFDPMELQYLTLNTSCYWYQENKNNKTKEYVTRSIIVAILRQDINRLMEGIVQ